MKVKTGAGGIIAAQAVVDALDAAGGDGGVIAVDAHGAVAMPFSTEGMYRGFARVTAEGGAPPELRVFIWESEITD